MIFLFRSEQTGRAPPEEEERPAGGEPGGLGRRLGLQSSTSVGTLAQGGLMLDGGII